MRGFVRVSAAVPRVAIADFESNREQILSLWRKADESGSVVVCFPELSVTSYSAKDLFHNTFLLKETEKQFGLLVENSNELKTVAIVGMPAMYNNGVYNCAATLQEGKVLGVIPKSYLPNYNEFEEGRWFRSGAHVKTGSTISILGNEIPFGTDVLLSASNIQNCVVGIEICEDLWVQKSPHIHQVNAGATIIANPSASNFTIGKSDVRESLAKSASDKGKCSYIYVAAAPGESSDLAWDGHHFICENGSVVARGSRFSREPQLLTYDIDVESLVHDRMATGTFGECADMDQREFRRVKFVAHDQNENMKLLRRVDAHPFVPSDQKTLAERCWEVFEIQTNSLMTRLQKIGSKTIILGISGGVDSTMAALAAAKTLDSMNLDRSNLICVTMPGLGTTDGTKEKAVELSRLLGTTLFETSIRDASYMVMSLIGHEAVSGTDNASELIERLKGNPEFADVTMENIQARIRTLVLMSYANKYKGIVLGTSDLSEKALGWSTYAGDQISMYDINSGVPKTLIQFVIRWVANQKTVELARDHNELKGLLLSILDAPITPELIPAGFDGKICQLSENKIGPYELTDFFLYWHVRYGAEPQKILDIARHAFGDKYNIETLKKWLTNFYKRFSSQQFKRNASADGPKIGVVDLSPRVSWRMSTDTECRSWIEQVKRY